MLPLVEAIHTLKDQQWLVGKTVGQTEILKIWIYREENSYSLFVCATGKDRTPRRNVVGKDFESVEEVLDTLLELDALYRVTSQQLFFMLTSVRATDPGQVSLLEQQLVYGDAPVPSAAAV